MTTPDADGLRGVVTLERGQATGIELTIPAPDDAPGVHTIELTATTPAGNDHPRTFSPEFELQEPGGPDCETCLGAAPATWPLPA